MFTKHKKKKVIGKANEANELRRQKLFIPISLGTLEKSRIVDKILILIYFAYINIFKCL